APFRDRLRFGSRWYRMASASSLSRADWIAASYADGDPMRFARTPISDWAPYRSQVAQAAVREHRDPVRQAMAYERVTHLPAIVATGDRLTMGAAIEARLPFTDPALLEFAGLVKTDDLFSGPHGKQPLREAMVGRLPPEVLNRRKRGWTSPYSTYLRERPELRSWISRVPEHPTVAASHLGRDGARKVVDEFLSGDNRRSRDAWMLGRIVLWHQVCVERDREPFAER
ncbi:MAG TPA: asparagine synthase-related protein, partial [Candidatus Limnocylindrales bacterium]|nr:asparagine synthase-related protein [Candidatus Limnocylindrales bacterium]